MIEMRKDLKTLYIALALLNAVILLFASDFLWVWSFILIGAFIAYTELVIGTFKNIEKELAELKKRGV